MTFTQRLQDFGHSQPDKQAIILADRMITFGMLAAAIRSVSAAIVTAALTPDQIVGVRIENPIRHLIIVCALYRLGIVSLSVVGTERVDGSGLQIEATISDSLFLPSQFGRLIAARDDWFAAQYPDGQDPVGFANPDQLARIIWSSGTMNGAKAIGQTSRVVEQRIEIGYLTLGLKAWDRMMCLPPLTSSLGIGSALQALAYGHTLIIADSAIDALRMISLHKVDLLVANPNHLRELVAVHRDGFERTDDLVLIKFGGDAISINLLSEVQQRFCNDILCVYSSTETGPLAFGPIDPAHHVRGFTGLVAPWAEIEILGPDDQLLAGGQIGRVRAKTQSHGYNLAMHLAQSCEWVETGDLGALTQDGRLLILGRVGNAISSGPFLIPAEQVEQSVLGYVGIQDAAVVGHEDGKILLAIVAPDALDLDDLRRFLASCDPLWIAGSIRRVSAIARNGMGKIIRPVVAKWMD